MLQQCLMRPLTLLRGCFSMALFLINTFVIVIPFFLLILLRTCSGLRFRVALDSGIQGLVELWIHNNSCILLLTQKIDWDIQLCEGLDPQGAYFVVSNHQSWADVLIIQWLLNRKIPLLRFFIKQELRWVPILGLAWQALDFPIMHRYTQAQMRENPQLRGVDIRTTRQLCEKFKDKPVSIMNFLEGTRFNVQKQQQQNSPYQYLLKPKAGGIALAMNAMQGRIQEILDLTLVYHSQAYGVWDLMCGRIMAVTVRMQLREIPTHLLEGDYQNDAAYRAEFQDWINELWVNKNELIQSIQKERLLDYAA